MRSCAEGLKAVLRHMGCSMSMRSLVHRVEALNTAGDLMWSSPHQWLPKQQAINRYAWLKVAADVFLMRLISVYDGLLFCANDIFEMELEPHLWVLKDLKKQAVLSEVLKIMGAFRDTHEELRYERNSRVHQGWERSFGSCDQSFKMAALWEHVAERTRPCGRNNVEALGHVLHVGRHDGNRIDGLGGQARHGVR